MLLWRSRCVKFKSLAENLPPSGQGRIVADYNSLFTDLGDLYGVDVLQSFVSAVPANVLRFDFGDPRTLQLLGVTHRIERGEIRPVPQAMPRAWIVHQANDAALPALEQCPEAGSATFARPDSDSVLVQAQLACRGLLVVSEAFYPGWNAYVDGQPQPIYEVFGALRGVVLESGSHRVEMRYRPSIVAIGAALSFPAIALGLFLAFYTRHERQRCHT